MDIREITRAVDHTLLTPTATWEEIRRLMDDGIKHGVASVCIPPCYVKRAKEYGGDVLPVCTVVGFPNGYNATAAKVAETCAAVADGADEVDMVINLGWLKAGRWDDVLEEITALRNACPGKILKVIVETCLLTEEEKIRMCQIVSQSGADFIKTSTGFSSGGATPKDIMLFAQYVSPHVRIKAAGGIRTLDDAVQFLNLGASRLGTSSIVKILNQMEADNY